MNLKRKRAPKDKTSSNKKVRWELKSPEDYVEAEREEFDELDDTAEEEEQSRTCVSATSFGGRLGAAFFDDKTRTLYLVEDTAEGAHFDLTRMLIEQARPEMLIVSSRAAEDFLELCRDLMEQKGSSFQVRPHREFVPDKGRDKLLSLSIFHRILQNTSASHSNAASDNYSGSHNAYDSMKCRQREIGGDPVVERRHALIRLSSYSGTEIPLCLSSAAALLDYLCRMKAAGDLENEGVIGLDIQNIELLALNNAMQINADALSSLQIFEDESHASIHSAKSKEGMSLFGILNHTKTSAGRILLRQWLHRPLLSLTDIVARHDALACFIRVENLDSAEAMHSNLAQGFRKVPRAIKSVRMGISVSSDWMSLVQLALQAALLMENIGNLSNMHGVVILQKLQSSIDTSRLNGMGALINSFIDWESSAAERRICVRPNIDEHLDEMKRVYHGLDNLLSSVAREVSRDVPKGMFESLNVLYFPQLGYLVCVPLNPDWNEPTDFEVADGWTFQFSSEDSAYYKSTQMLDLDEHIGDIHTCITDREIDIIRGLEVDVLGYETEILLACDVAAELDCLLSLATASRAYEYARPDMVEDNVIMIRKGRHPLVEQLADLFVPNDAYVVGGNGGTQKSSDNIGSTADDSSTSAEGQHITERRNLTASVVICTGANACGKSVYLKQNALIPFMAQIGCFVPAEAATLGIVDKSAYRLKLRCEELSLNLRSLHSSADKRISIKAYEIPSAFMIDLNQVSLALRNATERSLIILDEFGKGTTPADGAGLFCGVIQHLLALQNTSDNLSRTPKVLAATHFHEIFHNGLLDIQLPINYVHMEALLSKNTGELVELDGSAKQVETAAGQVEIHYLYRVAQGLSLNSHATKCALMYGIPRAIVDRAEHVSDLISHHELGCLLDEDMTAGEKKDLEDADIVCRAFVAWDLDGEVVHTRAQLGEILGVGSK